METSMLTKNDLQFYQENGYCLYKKQLFNGEKLAQLTSIFEDHLAHKGEKLSDELDTPHVRDERLLEFLLADEVLDLIEPILGPNIGLFSSHFICKDPLTGRRTPWHTDEAYWRKVINRFDSIVTVWLAIDRSNKENGCLAVIPGTHKIASMDHEDVGGYLNLEIKNMDTSKAVYFELERGQCSLHDARIVHGANENASAYRRCGYTMRYFAADAKILNPGNYWLARGEDVAGNSLLQWKR